MSSFRHINWLIHLHDLSTSSSQYLPTKCD